jgi:hypothetical protein
MMIDDCNIFIVQATGLLENIRLGCKWLGSDRGISPQCFSANYCREKFYNTGPRSVSLTLVGGCENGLGYIVFDGTWLILTKQLTNFLQLLFVLPCTVNSEGATLHLKMLPRIKEFC